MQDKKPSNNPNLIRLNKYLSNAGICSRREADKLIADGLVKVNGKVITEMGHKVSKRDKIEYNGQKINRERKVYVLLNKPKGFITTMSDDRGRKTVMDLVGNATEERIYPVGRLDRNTTGLLLFTNDGELTEKLTHPKHEVKKIYHAVLDKELKSEHIAALRDGFDLEDGFIKADQASYVEGEKKNHIGVEIHSGKNRIVRRMFESLGYDVTKLDRVLFASLTKKDLPRGQWRHLHPDEVRMLKNFL